MGEPRYETIRPRTRLLGRRLIHLASVPSTMDEARRLAQEAADSGTVVIADHQTRGRGRAERTWHSPPGTLSATLLIRAEVPVSQLPLLSLATGLAIARAIHRLLRIEAGLKWPNDVWIGQQKVAGVLIETRLEGARVDHVLVGFGVNGNLRREDLPLELQDSATSLSIAARRHVCLPALLKLVLEDLDETIRQLAANETVTLLDAVRRHSIVLGRRVRVETAEGPTEGTAREIGPLGELLVESAGRTRAIHVGDCQLLRPLVPASGP